jgi:hypothetical protein
MRKEFTYLCGVMLGSAGHDYWWKTEAIEKEEEMEDASTVTSHPLVCPFRESQGLRHFGHDDSAHRGSCGGLLGGALLPTLSGIISPLDVLRTPTCECGHP